MEPTDRIFPFPSTTYAKHIVESAVAKHMAERRKALATIQQLEAKKADECILGGSLSTGNTAGHVHSTRNVSVSPGKLVAVGHYFLSRLSRLGTARDWTQYVPTTILAIEELRELIKHGDPVTKCSIPRAMETRVHTTQFWFRRFTDAVSILPYIGIGDSRFGSGVSRIDAIRSLKADGTCAHENHRHSLAAYKDEEIGPPTEPCGCFQVKRLLDLLSVRMNEHAPHLTFSRLRKAWREMNAGKAFLAASDWLPDGDNEAIKFTIDGLELEIKFWKYTDSEDIQHSGMRVEGRFAELL
jgi:hypothetical protein